MSKRQEEDTGRYDISGIMDIFCPFCGQAVPNDFSSKGLEFYEVYHAEDCFFRLTKDNLTK